jgi:competence protein ComEC
MVAAAVAWMGAAAGWGWGFVAAAGWLLAFPIVRAVEPGRRLSMFGLGVIFLATVTSGALARSREDATLAAVVPEGPATIAGRVAEEPVPGLHGARILLEPTHVFRSDAWEAWRGPRLVAYPPAVGSVTAGDSIVVAGTLQGEPQLVRGDPVAGRIAAAEVLEIFPASDPLFAAGNAVRDRIAANLTGREGNPAAVLLRGFLIGDVADLTARDHEALRRSGLSHFVAVSGSNVALFLAAWWIVLGPLGFDPRLRAGFGLAGLAVFTVVTRWEPSVIRAATMAGLVLGGTAAGMPLDTWTALGAAVTGLLLVSGDLAGEVGFQLSVAATAGVLAGARIFAGRRPSWAWTALAATISAQIAVAPLLLVHFGAVPLLSPLANLAAAPLVAAATTGGGIGVLVGIGPLVDLAVFGAGLVLRIARLAAGWPQLGPAGLAVAAAAAVAARNAAWRPFVVLGVGAVLLTGSLPVAPPPVPTAVFLDVGQGDAILLLGPDGETVLVDGGPDEMRLLTGLRRYGVDRLDLLVLTHRHADHLRGLTELPGSLPIGAIWHSPDPDRGDLLPGILAAAAELGIPAAAPVPGDSATLGSFRIEVLGPLRRYASPNDGSLVLLVTAGDATLLLPGDIETFAQKELGPVPVDVLKVPHQGAATSDPDWLAATVGGIAVITVGSNDYGHPAPEIVALLREAGARVFRTDRDGDVVVRLASGSRSEPLPSAP